MYLKKAQKNKIIKTIKKYEIIFFLLFIYFQKISSEWQIKLSGS